MCDTEDPGLSQSQRIYLLGQSNDLNFSIWILATVRSSTTLPATQTPSADTTPHLNGGYTSSRILPTLEDSPPLPKGGHKMPPLPQGPPPAPHPWTPRFNPENIIYTDGSDIQGQHRLGAAVIHVPTRTTIYIADGGSKEIQTIMRAELIAIYTTLATLTSHDWIGIFTYSLSRL